MQAYIVPVIDLSRKQVSTKGALRCRQTATLDCVSPSVLAYATLDLYRYTSLADRYMGTSKNRQRRHNSRGGRCVSHSNRKKGLKVYTGEMCRVYSILYKQTFCHQTIAPRAMSIIIQVKVKSVGLLGS
jgi:hypothetical protein